MPHFQNIHQILPSLASGDAIGNQAVQLQHLLRQRGYASEIFAGGWDANSASKCKPYRSYSTYSHPRNLLIFHYSIGGEVNEFVKHLPDQKAMIYHNVTPGHFFRGFHEPIADLCDEARSDLTRLAGQMPVIADSPYNALEIADMGFEVIEIVPPVVDFNRLQLLVDSPDAESARRQFGKRHTRDWLFVGRQVPNKCIQDIIRAFYFYHTYIEPQSRLLLVGGSKGMELYTDWLHRLVTLLGLEGAVVFAGHQPDGALAAFYGMADIYLSMSEHEGFCVPVLEAMQFGVPVLAYNSTNVPYTLGQSGVLVNRKEPTLIAELAHTLCTHLDLRRQIIASQTDRLKAFSMDRVQQSFLAALTLLETKSTSNSL